MSKPQGYLFTQPSIQVSDVNFFSPSLMDIVSCCILTITIFYCLLDTEICLVLKAELSCDFSLRFDIKEETDDVVFQLMQKDAREKKQEGMQNLVIGFHIMQVHNKSFNVTSNTKLLHVSF